jgi:hypothetical protein
MAATFSRTRRSIAHEPPRAAPFLPFGSAADRGPRPDDELMADFIAAVSALPWATTAQLDEALIESFVGLGWLRRDGNFIGLTEEGARRYVAAAAPHG